MMLFFVFGKLHYNDELLKMEALTLIIIHRYLRNIVLKYMSEPLDENSREHIEAAIATVLRFTPEEIERVKSQRSSLLGSASSSSGFLSYFVGN